MKNNTQIKKNNSQNAKIAFIQDDFLVIGIDVGSDAHYARAFDNRRIELSKKPYRFLNSEEGFAGFRRWAAGIAADNGKKHIIAGMEPTGHYWFNLASDLDKNGIIVAHVNPAAVKKSKELDDNNPSKNDLKDPKVIAGLINDGRYCFPYMPTGVYAEIRDLSNLRLRCVEELTRVKNRLAKWFSIYFPEYREVYKNDDAKTGMIILKECPLPADIAALGPDGIIEIWRKNKTRGEGRKRAQKLVDAAKRSIGRRESSEAARMEIRALLEDFQTQQARLDQINAKIEEKLPEVPNIDKILAIKGVGPVTAATFVAEVGDISRFDDPKAIQKLAGLAIVNSQSGKHTGEYSISYRGRKRLRYGLYQCAISLVAKNSAFAAVHEYYTTRPNNQLKKMQSLIAVACKVIRVFYAILKKGTDFDEKRMLGDIVRPVTA